MAAMDSARMEQHARYSLYNSWFTIAYQIIVLFILSFILFVSVQELVHGGYHCQCPPGFVGLHCEVSRNKCASGPCQNGGRCHVILDSFVCECPPNYAGMLCEVRIFTVYSVKDIAIVQNCFFTVFVSIVQHDSMFHFVFGFVLWYLDVFIFVLFMPRCFCLFDLFCFRDFGLFFFLFSCFLFFLCCPNVLFCFQMFFLFCFVPRFF